MDQCYSSMLQLSFIWQAKENTSLRIGGELTQKLKEKRSPLTVLAFLFTYFFSSL